MKAGTETALKAPGIPLNGKGILMTFSKVTSDFYSRGTRCSGWLYRPDGVADPPLVIMAHGFAAEKTFGLCAFAERFAGEGLAVLLFDYRNFGDSDGKPRNLVSHHRHLQDWQAAVAHARTLDGIDTGRIALWGSSFSGGHVIVTAGREYGISALVAQVPFVDGLSSVRMMGSGYVFKAVLAGCRDLLRVLSFREPYYVPVVGEPGAFAVMNTPESRSGYLAIVPPGTSWKNRCPARILLSVPFYRPISRVGKVKCPALIVMAENDSLISPQSVRKAASRMIRAELLSLPAGHFDPYLGETFDWLVEQQAAFLKKHLFD